MGELLGCRESSLLFKLFTGFPFAGGKEAGVQSEITCSVWAQGREGVLPAGDRVKLNSFCGYPGPSRLMSTFQVTLSLVYIVVKALFTCSKICL
jgi:hypothetical protein